MNGFTSPLGFPKTPEAGEYDPFTVYRTGWNIADMAYLGSQFGIFGFSPEETPAPVEKEMNGKSDK